MGERNYLKLNDLSSYKVAFELSNYIWEAVKKWDYLAVQTIGRQLINATDSISANIAEGFGRRSRKDKIKFYYYSYGSACEAIDWIEKAKKRELISEDQYNYIFSELDKLPKEINALVKFTRERMLK